MFLYLKLKDKSFLFIQQASQFTMSEKKLKKKLFYIRPELLICLLLIVAATVVYGQVKNFDFVNLDDDDYISDNIHVQKGLTVESIKWAFTSPVACNWHPLTMISYMIDFQFFGMSPGKHHLTNLFFHLLNILLLFHILKVMSGDLWKSAFVAAMFAVHPLHVESVAWISERKDVLSAFFWLLTMWNYVKYVHSSKSIFYLLSILFFIFGLMAKPMLVTLPFVLILLDFWPLKRIINHDERNKLYSQQKSLIRLIILEKIPFLIITGLSIYITLYFQQKGGAIAGLETYPLNLRISNALLSYVLYIWKMIYPYNLAAYYPYPDTLPWWKITWAFLLISVISVTAFRTLKSHPFLCTGWLWYLGTLVPVIGLVQVGSQAMADRYTYIPLIGIYIIIAWGFPITFAARKYRKQILAGLAVIYFLLLVTIARIQTGYWKDSITLFKHALQVTRENSTAHFNLAIALDNHGRETEAMNHYIKTLSVLPDQPKARSNLALILTSHGKPDEAINQYNEILRLHPDDAIAHNNLGTVLLKKGKVFKALSHFNEAVSIEPDYSDARYNRDMLRVVLKKILQKSAEKKTKQGNN